MDADEKAKLKAEWARAQGTGRVLGRKRFVATAASMLVTFGIVAAAYAAMVFYLSLDQIPVVSFALPWALALPVGWFVRRKLLPRSQFDPS
jgi:hypothetical protein